MSRRACVVVVFEGEDGSLAQTLWEVGEDDAHALIRQLHGLLGEHACEAVFDASAAAVIHAARPAVGIVASFAGDSG